MYQPYFEVLWQRPRGDKLRWRHRRTICTTHSTHAHMDYVWLCYYSSLFFHFLLFNIENVSNNSALVSFNLTASEISNSPQLLVCLFVFAGWTTQQSVLYQLWLVPDFPLFRLSSNPPQLQPHEWGWEIHHSQTQKAVSENK